MLGVNITTKNGLLLFSHFFVPGFTDVDEDLRAGLMSAVLNAVRETEDDGTGLKTIDQGRYYVHITEGRFTYGLFFSFENDLKEITFATQTLQQFEYEFRQKLANDISIEQDDYTSFLDYLKEEYSRLISIDVVALSKVIEFMDSTNYDNFIVLERPYLNQVFTTISIPAIHPHANQIAMMIKNLIEGSFKIKQEISKLRFNLGEKFFVGVFQLKRKFFLILIVENETKDRERIEKEMLRIQKQISNRL